jgi:hypothetical protein
LINGVAKLDSADFHERDRDQPYCRSPDAAGDGS